MLILPTFAILHPLFQPKEPLYLPLAQCIDFFGLAFTMDELVRNEVEANSR